MSRSSVAKFYISGRGSPVHLLCREKMISYVQHAEKVQRKEAFGKWYMIGSK